MSVPGVVLPFILFMLLVCSFVYVHVRVYVDVFTFHFFMFYVVLCILEVCLYGFFRNNCTPDSAISK